MKKLFVVLLLVCLALSGCGDGTYKNSIELDSGTILLYDNSSGGWLDFIATSGDRAHLQFSGIRELDRFYVNYLDENGEIKDEKLRELKKRMEELE